ncbi:MAG: hypothetical protein GY786_03105 [Proteobacteria bacterium]|nr:hypothetical protein [Pseudomonadota bacterium]
MPTIDSARVALMINYLNANKGSTLLIGGPGTAKTSSVLMYSNKFDSS